jgi:energy-coupling factor transport system ATP-binding protein
MAAMAGVLGGADEGEQEGSLTVDGLDARAARGHVGLVLQDPDSQTILARLGDDVAFGCENLGLPREEIWRRVRRALEIVGLWDLELDHSTSALSGGQRQRLALAGALAMQPGLLLLDEPTANLDPDGVREVRDAVRRVLDSTGETLVVVEHHVDIWLPLVDRVIVVSGARENESGADGVGGEDGAGGADVAEAGDSAREAAGGIIADGSPAEVFARCGQRLAASGTWVPGRELPDFSPNVAGTGAGTGAGAGASTSVRENASVPRAILSTSNLSFGRDSQALGSNLNLEFRAGEVAALMGPNGAGKTTLALTIAGLLAPLGGSVEYQGELPESGGREPIAWRSRELLGRIGMVMQEPEHQFVGSSVLDEVMVGLKSLGRSEAQARAEADSLLGQLGLKRFGPANPFTLSGGEKRRLSVASMLAAAPQVVVMDEPTFGQDFATWTAMARLIAQIRDEGKAVIIVTHDEDLVRTLGARRIMFAENAGSVGSAENAEGERK